MRRLLNYFLRYFVRGVLLVAPLVITAYITYQVFVTIDGWLGRWIRLPPGAGFVITILLITLFGFLASSLLTRELVALLERSLDRLPIVRHLYSSTRDFLNAFVGERRRFDKPVIVSLLPGGSARALGFVTQESLPTLGLAGHVGVYFPQSYNFAGSLLIFPADQVERLDADSASVMAFIVSGGVTEIPKFDGHGALSQ